MVKDLTVERIPQCKDYYCRELKESLEVVSRNELLYLEKKYLKKFNTTSLGANSKVYFLDNTDFPRYRLRDYGRDKNISITRDISKADVVIADKKSFKTQMSLCYGVNKTNLGLRGLSTYSYKGGHSEYYKFDSVQEKLGYVDELLNYNGKILDVADLTKVVCAGRMIWDFEQAINIDRMLGSSIQDDCDLALEMIANSDLEENMVKNYILLCKHYYSNSLVRNSNFTNSVNFKTVASYYGNLGLSYYDYHLCQLSNILANLRGKNTEFTPSDVELIDYYVKKEVGGMFGSDVIESMDFQYNLPMKEYKEEVQETFSFTGAPRI